MRPLSRLVAAVLVPLVACAPAIRVRHRDGVVPDVKRESPNAATVQVTEADFTPAFRVLGRQAPVWSRPLESARRLFEVPERSGTYLYEVRTERLMPEAPDGPMLGEVSEQEFVRDYLQWCSASLGPGDCLRLLGKGRTYSSHARYSTALAIGWRSAMETMRETLRDMVSPDAVVATLFAAMAMYLMLWTVPEPFSKGIAAAMTIWLIGYFGFDPLWRLAKAWRALVEEADAALDFEALQRAGERFGERAGPGAARILILVATLAIGGTAGMAAKGTSLPGFAVANTQAQGQLGVSLVTATAAESVLVGTQTVTITYAPGLLAMSAANPRPGPVESGKDVRAGVLTNSAGRTLDLGAFRGLTRNPHTVAAGRSGAGRALTGPSNSYSVTEGGHALVYGPDGRLLYDVSASRIKAFEWHQAPNGQWFPRTGPDLKFPDVPQAVLDMLGL